MKNIRTFNSTVLGESHKASKKVCQDASDCYEDTSKGLYICAISDGHGSDIYFRSDKGAKLLVKIAIDSIRQFVENVDNDLFAVSFKAVSARTTEVKNKVERKVTRQDEAFRRLFASVIAQWNEAITKDWAENAPTMEEMKAAKVPDSAIKSFMNGEEIEIAYGCTIIAIAHTNEYWFAFQLGDGKCIAFDNDAKWSEPIPWDDQCSGNTTTSICEGNSIDNFRYCYGNDNFPVALFIGSDGMDGAYGIIDEYAVPGLALFYSSVIKSFVKNGYKITLKEIKDSLLILSARGISRDDMSVAGIIDMNEIPKLLPLIIKADIETAKNELTLAEGVYNTKEKDLLEKESEIKQRQEEVISLKNRVKEQEEISTNANRILITTTEEIKKKEIEIQKAVEDLNFIRPGFEKSAREKDAAQKKLDTLMVESNELYSNPESKVEKEDMTIAKDNNDEIEERASSGTKKNWWERWRTH